MNVAPTAVTLMPSDSAILPSIVTSGASRLMIRLLLWISDVVTMQSFGVVSNRPRIVLPVDPSVQPHAFGVAFGLHVAPPGLVAAPQQSRTMIGAI